MTAIAKRLPSRRSPAKSAGRINAVTEAIAATHRQRNWAENLLFDVVTELQTNDLLIMEEVPETDLRTAAC